MLWFNLRSFSKFKSSIAQALEPLKSGMSVFCGGFGLCGTPISIIHYLAEQNKIKDLTMISNTIGTTNEGLGLLVKNQQIKKMVASYVGENKNFQEQYFQGEVELELTPQGTLAEKIRSGGFGIKFFATPTGVDTLVEKGGFIQKYKKSGYIQSQPKQVIVTQEKKYLLEETLRADVAIIKAFWADKEGNLQFNKTAQNFNPDMAKAGKYVVVEVDEFLHDKYLNSSKVDLPGIFVDAIVLNHKKKPIEKLTNSVNTMNVDQGNIKVEQRLRIARRAAQEIEENQYVNLGIGIPSMVSAFLDQKKNIIIHSEAGMLGLDGFPEPGKEDPDLIDPTKQTIKEKKGASYFSSSDAFGIVRGGHLSATFLGAMEVSSNGDIANWLIPEKMVKGMGGAMDLVASGSKVVVLTTHTDKYGWPKILNKCKLPLTGSNCVSKIITELAVFQVRKNKPLLLTDIYEKSSVEEIKQKTECEFEVSASLKIFK